MGQGRLAGRPHTLALGAGGQLRRAGAAPDTPGGRTEPSSPLQPGTGCWALSDTRRTCTRPLSSPWATSSHPWPPGPRLQALAQSQAASPPPGRAWPSLGPSSQLDGVGWGLWGAQPPCLDLPGPGRLAQLFYLQTGLSERRASDLVILLGTPEGPVMLRLSWGAARSPPESTHPPPLSPPGPKPGEVAPGPLGCGHSATPRPRGPPGRRAVSSLSERSSPPPDRCRHPPRPCAHTQGPAPRPPELLRGQGQQVPSRRGQARGAPQWPSGYNSRLSGPRPGFSPWSGNSRQPRARRQSARCCHGRCRDAAASSPGAWGVRVSAARHAWPFQAP